MPALALAWVLAQGDHIVPIPGTRSADHLTDCVGAFDIVPSDIDRADLARLLPAGWVCGDRYGPDQAITIERYR